MKIKEFLFVTSCLFLILPAAVIAGGGDDDSNSLEQEIPTYSIGYVQDYNVVYSCTYRLNISETVNSGYAGTFDFSINFSKETGEVTAASVSQISEISDLTDMTANKLLVKTNISKIAYKYSDGYTCPSLMVMLTDEMDEKVGKENIIFNLENEDVSKIAKTSSVYNSWLTVHNYYVTKYNCKMSDKESCQNKQYCEWGVIDSHHTYGCREMRYQKEENAPPSTVRTAACTGYLEPVFKQSIEYMFTADGKLNIAEGAGDFAMFPNNNSTYVDKDNALYELWKNGGCCATNKLAISYNNDSVVVSCDGNGDWVYNGVNTNSYCKTEFDELASQLGIISKNITQKNQIEFYNKYKKAANCCKQIYSDLNVDSSSDDYNYCDKITGKVNDPNINLLNEWVTKDYFGNRVISGNNGTDCKGILGSLGDWLSRIYNILKLAVPAIIVAMGFKDFIQGMSSDKDDALKKAGTNFIKRLVVGAVFVMLPMLIKMILTFAFGGSFSDICITL